jgi:transglutaminase-like putative cysteine protease
MTSHWFDDVARSIANLGQRRESRRSLLRAAGAGGALALLPRPDSATATERMRSIRALNQERPVDPLIDDTAFSLGYDRDQIFQFVRDQVAYDPYAGVLRGAQGTVRGLAGNAADQAILLAALLDASLIETRFAIGELSAEAADALLASAQWDAETIRRQTRWALRPPATDGEPPALSAEETAFAEQVPDFATRFREAVKRNQADGLSTVTEALTAAGIEIPEPATSLPDLERRQHVWLQAIEGATWIDLDPSISGSEPGTIHARDTETRDDLPPEWHHQVTLRLVAEQIVGGNPAENELLSYSGRSSDLDGVPLTVFHPQAAAIKALGQQITGEVGGFRNFMTTLLVGDETVSGLPVTFGADGGGLDVFGESAAIDGDTIAEWLEIEIQTPTATRQIRRDVFDRVGAATRAKGPIDLSAIPPLETVDAGDPEATFLPLAGLLSISVVTGPVGGSPLGSSELSEPQIADLARIAHAYHFARDVLSLPAQPSGGARVFLDAPNLTAFVLRPTDVSAGQQSAVSGLDLLYRSVTSVGDADPASASAQSQVAFGVMSHAVEQALVEMGADPLLDLPIETTVGVGRVFAAARDAGLRTLVIQPNSGSPELPDVTDEARIRIERALQAGYVVIVPERSVTLGGAERSGWWLVDPASGATIDQMDNGGGLQLAEYILAVVKGMACVAVFVALAACAYFVAIQAAKTLVPGQDEGSADADAAEAAAAGRAAAANSAGSNAASSGVVGGASAIACVA